MPQLRGNEPILGLNIPPSCDALQVFSSRWLPHVAGVPNSQI
jgi:hypothetical protein